MRLNKYLLPVNGYEKTFLDQSKGYKNNITGANCYSYAMDHFETNKTRPNKTVPGDLVFDVMRKKHPFTDWQTCKAVINRIRNDGIIAKKLHKLNIPVVKMMKGSLVTQEKKMPPLYYRKVCVVVETNEEKKGVPTDFHFYAQNKILLKELYNSKRVCYPKKDYKNIYNEANINAFLPSLHIKRKMNGSSVKRRMLLKTILNRRPVINFNIHVSYIPPYMIDFIPDPFWLLDIPIGKRNKKTVKAQFCKLHKIFKHYSPKKKEIYMKLLFATVHEAILILNKKKAPMSRNMVIGLWSHKLGHATAPLNTDGNFHLIFNPRLASRYHGSYDYDKVCRYFLVLSGYGTTRYLKK